MRRSPLLATLLGFLSLVGDAGCGHTKKVEGPAADQASDAPVAGKKEKPAGPSAKSSSGPPGKSRAKNEKQTAASDPPLASDPLQMLTTNGRDQLKNSLQKKGYLKGAEDSIPQALRKFQAEHKFPETGMPDDDTLIKLGLEPKDVVVTVRPKD